MVLLRADGIIQKVLLAAVVVLWLPFIIYVLDEAVYFVGFVPLGGCLWLGRSRFYRPRKPAPLSSASGGTTATASGATAATKQTPSSETGQADEKEFQPAAAGVGFFFLFLQMFASTYWHMSVPKDVGLSSYLVAIPMASTTLLALIIDELTE